MGFKRKFRMTNNKREISRRLLDPEFTGSLDPPPAPEIESIAEDPIAMARKVASRSKRRVTILTWATSIAWILAIAAGCAVAFFYSMTASANAMYGYSYSKARVKINQLREKAGDRGSDLPTRYLNEAELREYYDAARGKTKIQRWRMNWTLTASLLTGFAALMSVRLITSSRRCTMKQINANLAAICHELKSMSAE